MKGMFTISLCLVIRAMQFNCIGKNFSLGLKNIRLSNTDSSSSSSEMLINWEIRLGRRRFRAELMDTEQYIEESSLEDLSSLDKWKSSSDDIISSDYSSSSGFECNICLDFVQDPVVTLCGHLYCWPCIYKWLHFRGASSMDDPNDPSPQCPVCKAEVSDTTLIPLYGRGQTTRPSESKGRHLGLVIPRRPSGPGCSIHTLVTTTNSDPAQLDHGNIQDPSEFYYPYPSNFSDSPMIGHGGSTRSMPHPVVGMFGEMIYARMFGNSETNLYSYSYPNSYNLAGSTNPRIRRHLVKADRSLSRISFFLFCCVITCLLLF
ncbi:Zinc finger, C3HC4 RING-type [Dillenia turbinata]|uniref:E3 ubiquitin-protein ligase RMA n=1 Tax=Dillenia turbinata TaxID=194707 RepID=A0AAN8V1A3_9MAGN